MKNITDKLTLEYPENFWDFKGSIKEGVHTIGKYPATMVAQMQYELMGVITSRLRHNDITILDPFCGSGTTLVLAREMNFNSIGIDLNPYAVLLSKVKTTGYNRRSINNSIEKIVKRLKDVTEYQLHDFANIEKWFREDIIEDLSRIRVCIQKEKNKNNRDFFWVCFSEIIFKYSSDRTSTFKLHRMKQENILNIENNCTEDFIAVVKQRSEVLNYNTSDKESYIYQGDSKKKLSEMKGNSVSFVCTSPPYGDNATTVTYGQFSILFLKWISADELKCDGELIDTYSKIDSLSLGGKKRERKLTEDVTYLGDYLSKVSDDKKRKIVNFFEDYFEILKELKRVVRKGGYILLTVGNRTVDGQTQPLDSITIEIAQLLKLKVISRFERNIPSKSMPLKVSRINGEKPVNSMTRETVIILKK